MTLSNEALADKFTAMANGLRGSMWANRDEIIGLLDAGAVALLTPPVREDVLEVVKHAWDAGYSTGQDYRDDPPFAGLGKHNRRHGWETYACSLSDRNLVVSAPTTPENSELVMQAGDPERADEAKLRAWVEYECPPTAKVQLRHAFFSGWEQARIEATRTAQATPAADIVLVSAGFGEDGYQLHGLFAHFEGALAHVRKDEADEQIRWQNHADDRRFVVCGEVQWVASRQPIRARTSDPIHAEGEGYD